MKYDPYLAAICPWPTEASRAGRCRGAYRRAWLEHPPTDPWRTT